MAGRRLCRGAAGLLAAVLLGGCGSSTSSATPAASEAALLPGPTLLAAGTYSSVDTDADGTAEVARYTFPGIELVPGIDLERTVALERTDGAGRITLSFRYVNTGSARVSATHRITIPKSIAASVDQLTFSRPPTRVIEADPVVEEDVTLDYGEVEELVVSATEQIGSGGVSAKAANAAWLAMAMGVEECLAMTGRDRDICLVSVVRDVARDLPASDVAPVCRYVASTVFNGACVAIVMRNPGECRSIVGANTWRDPCIRIYAQFACMEFKDAAGRDRCRIGLALDGDSITTCDDIKDGDMQLLCRAGVARNPTLCDRISDKGLAARCASAIKCGQSVAALVGASSAAGSPGTCASVEPSASESKAGTAPGLPVTLEGTFADYPKSLFRLTLAEAGATGTGKVVTDADGCPVVADFTFTGQRTTPDTWSGTAKVVKTSTASSQDALCQLQGDSEPVTVSWLLAFTPSGPTGSVEGWGELQLR
jgi:hypothetical protein